MPVKEIQKIDDHIDRSIKRLHENFKGLEKKYPSSLDPSKMLSGWEALLTALVEPAQYFENLCFEILNNLDLNLAEGVFLDRLGELLGVDRLGRDDDEYRKAILLEIAKLSSEGRHRDITSLLKSTGLTIESYIEPAPATFKLGLGVVPDKDIVNVKELVQVAKAAGVGSELIGIPDDGDDPDIEDLGGYTFFGGVGSPAGTLQVKGGRYHLLID